MGLGLSNARLNVAGSGARPPVQQVKPARTSIAEDAVFIPKPHKRVDFKMAAAGNGPGDLKLAGSGGKADIQSIPLLGQAGDNGGGELKPLGAGGDDTPQPGAASGAGRTGPVTVSGQNIQYGSLGAHGLTAEFGKESYRSSQQLVKVEYSATPQKDFNAIAPQEEGRQTNHAKQVHYTQQYDAYGRPRIGFSREPYDFAATKYMVKTAQLKFQQNMQSTQQSYAKYSENGAATEAPGAPANGAPPKDPSAPAGPNDGMIDPEQAKGAKGMVDPEKAAAPKEMVDPEAAKGPKGMIDPSSVTQNFLGASKAPKGEMVVSDPKALKTLGQGAQMPEGMIDPAQAAAQKPAAPAAGQLLKGESAKAVAEKMGMQLNAVMTPAAVSGQGASAASTAVVKAELASADAGIGGKAVRDVAAMMGMNISAVLAAPPEKVANLHTSTASALSGAAVSVSA